MDWFLYDIGLHDERVKRINYLLFPQNHQKIIDWKLKLINSLDLLETKFVDDPL